MVRRKDKDPSRPAACPWTPAQGIISLRLNLRPSPQAVLLVLVLMALLLDSVSALPANHHHKHHPRHRHSRHKHHKILKVETLEQVPDTSASLSIINPLDVLRQNMLQEIQKKRVQDATTKQLETNREYLRRIG